MLGAPHARNVLVALAAMVLTGSLATPAVAGEGDAHSHHELPRECGERSEWLQGVRARLPPLLQTHPLLATLSVRIQKLVRDGGDEYAGALVSPSSSELQGARRVRGATCDEVLDALAFIAALGLERMATSPPATGTDGAGLRRDPEPPSSPVASQPVGAEASSRGGLSSAGGVQLGAVAFGLLQGGLAPGGSLALGAALRAAWSAPGWRPLLMLGAYSSLPEERRLEGGGRVRYEHWSLHAMACPWRIDVASFLGVRPCAELDVGRSSGEGAGVERAERHSAPWLSAGAQLRTELSVGRRFELAVSAAAVAPLFRSHFFLYPGVERFDTPALGLRAGSFATLLF